MTQGGRIKREFFKMILFAFFPYRLSRSTAQWNQPIGKVC